MDRANLSSTASMFVVYSICPQKHFISLVKNMRLVSRMTQVKERKYTGKCVDCAGPLELYEIDKKKNTKIMKCQKCGLLHFYKQSFFGKWKLLKMTKRDPLQQA